MEGMHNRMAGGGAPPAMALAEESARLEAELEAAFENVKRAW